MKPTVAILHWTPRILCLLTILIIGMFAMDSFSSDRNIWQNLGALMIHLLPSITLLVFLLIAWKWELPGGIILIVLGLAWSIFVYIINVQRTGSSGKAFLVILMLGIPLVLAGVLFIISHYVKKPDKQ
jgi:hypothetical protein